MQIIHATDNWGCASSPLMIRTYIISMQFFVELNDHVLYKSKTINICGCLEQR